MSDVVRLEKSENVEPIGDGSALPPRDDAQWSWPKA